MIEKLDKFVKGKVSSDELRDVIKLLGEEKNLSLVDKQMRHFWKQDENRNTGNNEKFDIILHEIHHKINISEKTSPSLFSRSLNFISKVAAILFIPLLISVYYLKNDRVTESNKSNYITYNTLTVPLCTQSFIILPDGSKVWLNSGTTIKYPSDLGQSDCRLIELEGEALFDIAKNPDKPFVVNTKDIDIKVLGTKFNIRSYDDEPKAILALAEGSVEAGIFKEDNSFSTLLKVVPGEVAFYSRSLNQLMVDRPLNLTKYFAWIDGKMQFEKDPIDIVMNKFSKMYNVEFEVKDPELYTYQFTATFINESLERALQIICTSSPIKYRIETNNSNETGVFKRQKIILYKK